MKLSEASLPNVLPPALAPYAKVVYGIASAVITALILAVLSTYLGIAVDTEIITGCGVTWRSAVNALLPLAFVYLVPNGAALHLHDVKVPPDDDGKTTLGTEVAPLFEGAGPRGEPSQA